MVNTQFEVDIPAVVPPTPTNLPWSLKYVTSLLSATKPPQSIRTVPILKQSLSDSGVGKSFTQNQSNRSRNSSSQSAQDERLQKVHEELEVISSPTVN